MNLDEQYLSAERQLEILDKALKSETLVGTQRLELIRARNAIFKKLKTLEPIVEVTPPPEEVVAELPAPVAQSIEESVVADDSDLDLRRFTFDFVYAASHFPIDYRPGMQDTEDRSGPLLLTDAQKKLASVIISKLFIESVPLRMMILKSRQLGCTTELLALAMWLCQTIQGFRVLFIIDKDAHLHTKRRNLLLWAEHLSKISPALCNIKRGGKGQKHLELPNGSIIFLDSAQSPNPGTSDMYHLVITSEEPKWVHGRPEQVKASLFPGVPEAPRTGIIRESTAEGLGLFYRDWLKSVQGKSGFLAFFAPWYLSQEYRKPPAPNFAPYQHQSDYSDVSFEDDSKELTEAQYGAKYKLDNSQLQWRRIIIDKMGSRAAFDQEYPTTWRHAFRSVSLGFYPPSLLDSIEESIRIRKPIFVGDIVSAEATSGSAIHYSLLRPMLSRDPAGPLRILERPIVGEQYFAGIDCAEGHTTSTDEGEDPDWTVITVKESKGRNVAKWRGRCRPEEAWLPLCLLGVWYNMALLNGERQNAAALMFQIRLSAYPNIHIEPEPSHRPAAERMWVYIDRGNRGPILSAHRLAMREDPTRAGFENLWSEMTAFAINKQGKPCASPGFHDDDVMSDVNAEYGRQVYLGLWTRVTEQPMEADPRDFKLTKPPDGQVSLWQTTVSEEMDLADLFPML